MNKQIGCDNCGEAKPVKASKGGRVNNWQKQYLCEDCQITITRENDIMRQQIKGGE